MRARHGHFWCETCDEPGDCCRGRKGHRVVWVPDAPVRPRWGEGKEQVLASLEVSPERGRELFEEMRARIAALG